MALNCDCCWKKCATYSTFWYFEAPVFCLSVIEFYSVRNIHTLPDTHTYIYISKKNTVTHKCIEFRARMTNNIKQHTITNKMANKQTHSSSRNTSKQTRALSKNSRPSFHVHSFISRIPKSSIISRLPTLLQQHFH